MFLEFFLSIHGKGKAIQNRTFGLRAALLANESYSEKQAVDWNPTTIKLL